MLKWFRFISAAEGTSFLVLLCIAMPLKYALDLPAAVKVVGWAHGLLFVLYLIALFLVTIIYRWSMLRLLGGFIAAFLPLGPFVLEWRIRKDGSGR